jgi:adenosylcobinamide-GDP ribazoletransferase
LIVTAGSCAVKFTPRASISRVSGLLVAARYLTIVPIPGRPRGGDLGRAAPWFPAVGLGLGAALVLTDWVTSRLFPPLLAALLVVTAWKLLTGGLHLDGLADCLDGLVGRDVDHRLAIMRDSRIGAFGAIGLILFLFLEIVAVSELPPSLRWRTLLVTPAIARAMPALLGGLFRPARREGHGAAFHAGLHPVAAPIAIGLAVALSVAALFGLGLVAVAVAAIAAVAVAMFLSRRLRGITGDVLGAAVEVAELAVLLTVIAWMHAGLL